VASAGGSAQSTPSFSSSADDLDELVLLARLLDDVLRARQQLEARLVGGQGARELAGEADREVELEVVIDVAPASRASPRARRS
jgi:hypothetical protein